MSDLPDILQRIVDRRRARIESQRSTAENAVRSGARPAASVTTDGGFVRCLTGTARRAVIAEVKLGSPRLGSLVDAIDPEAQARLYSRAGAAALSVVVEPDFFFGSYELLGRCREASGLPTLAKDFVIDPVQLEWSARAGADAVLLIAAIVSRNELLSLARHARDLGLVPLVECHSPSDIAKLGEEPWELVGVNNRDLRSFEVDLERSIALLDHLPAAARKVAESGIATRADIERLAAAGFDAFLVGESLLTAPDPAASLRRLVGGERST